MALTSLGGLCNRPEQAPKTITQVGGNFGSERVLWQTVRGISDTSVLIDVPLAQ